MALYSNLTCSKSDITVFGFEHSDVTVFGFECSSQTQRIPHIQKMSQIFIMWKREIITEPTETKVTLSHNDHGYM